MAKSSPYLVEPDSKIKLSNYDPDDTGDLNSKSKADKLLEQHREKLSTLQDLMYAEAKHSLLVVLQAMDAAGKDGTIRHIFTGVNPQGCQVTSFKKPTLEELKHDFLWRVHRATPARGMIGIFNRSHYEDVLVVRVHGNLSKNELKNRFQAINHFEDLLVENGTNILKFFLHISKDEQKRRLEERIQDQLKNWKISEADFSERRYWNDYMDAYQDALSHCSTKRAPWYVIPAEKKWFRNLAVSQIIVDRMKGLKMEYPPPKVDLAKLRVE